ncbi:MAG: hypothetical protein ACREL1_08160 [bacterium]
MKFWSRWTLISTAFLFLLAIAVTPASAKSKKKKKHEAKMMHHEMVVQHHEIAYHLRPIVGANMNGRPGYFYADTASTPSKNQLMGAAHVIFSSPGSELTVPFGAAYGITNRLQVHASTSFYTGNGLSGLNNLTFGGKYGFPDVAKGLDIAAGLDFAIGPLSNAGYSTLSFDPYGVATYTFADGFQLNGQLGLYVPGGYSVTYNILGTPYTASYSLPAYLQFNAGVAYPFDSKLTGIAEIAVNGAGNGDTPLVVGIRTGKDVQFQALGGLDLAGTVGVVLGGGISLFTE